MTPAISILIRRGYIVAFIVLLLLYALLFFEISKLQKITGPVLLPIPLITLKIIAVISLVIILAIIFYFFLLNYREYRAKEKADRSAQYFQQQLEKSITDLKQANLELMDLKSIEKFASTGRIARTLAHEVRNPLTNISLASEQLKELQAHNPDVDLLIEMISRNALRINQLVTDFLSSTRFAQLNFENADLNCLVNDALRLASDRIELNLIRVEKEFTKELCLVRVDKEKIKLAFVNIIVNAIEAMEKGSGILQIKTMMQNKKCLVEFKDNGSGMNKEALEKLFEPYFTTKIKGTGLGLTNTQNIIFNHRGSINVKSKPGQGTTFMVLLDAEK